MSNPLSVILILNYLFHLLLKRKFITNFLCLYPNSFILVPFQIQVIAMIYDSFLVDVLLITKIRFNRKNLYGIRPLRFRVFSFSFIFKKKRKNLIKLSRY